jgi:hypothetical protein
VVVNAFLSLEDDFTLVRERFDNASSPFDGVRVATQQHDAKAPAAPAATST